MDIKPSSSNQQSHLNDTIENVNETDQLMMSNNNDNLRPISQSKSDTLNSSQKVKFHSYNVNEDSNVKRLANDSDDERVESFDGKQQPYFLDEKGQIMKSKPKNEQILQKASSLKREHSGLSNASKPFKVKYNREDKSIEFSINLGDPNTGGSSWLSDLRNVSFYQALISEFIGTFLLVLYVGSFCLPVTDPSHAESVPSINGDIGSGLVVATLVWIFGNTGGANLNPAVTISLFLTGESDLLRVLFYIPSQIAGSILAAICIKELVPDHLSYPLTMKVASTEALSKSNDTLKQAVKVESVPLGVTLVNSSITPIQGFGVEVLITFILIFTIFACIDKRRNDLGGSFPLTIGFALTACSIFGGKFTGGSMNPARSFGPALINDNWENHWVYWAGPILGGILGGFAYKLLMLNRKTISKDD